MEKDVLVFYRQQCISMSKPFLASFLRLSNYQTATRWLIILAVVFTQSCNSPDSLPANPYDYFPLEVGRFQVYRVTEEVYTAGKKVPIKTWYEKHEITREIEVSQNGKKVIVSISTRNNPSEYWQKNKEYSVESLPDKIIVSKDGEVLTPLIFPYSSKLEWDGYQYFQLGKDDPRQRSLHHYEDMDIPLKVDSLEFARTLKVSERTDTTRQITYRLGFKIYASGVGMIEDEQTDFEYLQENGELVGDKVIGSGVSRIKRIVDYGIVK